MSYLDDVLRVRIDKQKTKDLFRQRSIRNGSLEKDFSTNDYLGLSDDREIIEIWKEAVSRYSSGSTGSGLISGYTDSHAELEEKLAYFLQRPAAIVTVSGYAANLAAITAISPSFDTIIADKAIHASLIDASQLSLCKLFRYPHNCLDCAGNRLLENRGERPVWLLEGIYSMDGTSTDLVKIKKIRDENPVTVFLDDAHGIGVLGNEGGGSCQQHGMHETDIDIVTGGFGKAFASAGGFVSGSKTLIDSIVQFGRQYIYSTAMPPAQAYTLTKTIDVVRKAIDRRDKLKKNIAVFRDELQKNGLPVSESTSPIQPVLIGDSGMCVSVASHIRQTGMKVMAIRPPTVRSGTARLRISLSCRHDEDTIKDLVQKIKEAVEANV